MKLFVQMGRRAARFLRRLRAKRTARGISKVELLV